RPTGVPPSSASRSARRAGCRAHPRNEFLGVRARVGGEPVAGMPQVVEMDTKQADRSERGKPHTAASSALSLTTTYWPNHIHSARLQAAEWQGEQSAAGKVEDLAPVRFGERCAPSENPSRALLRFGRFAPELRPPLSGTSPTGGRARRGRRRALGR